MKGITVYNNKFAIWHTRLRNELPELDGTANPMVWFGKCLPCQDIIVCGLDTKRECVEVVENHIVEDHSEE